MSNAPDVANETASKDKKKKKKSKSSSEANGEVVEEVSMADDLVGGCCPSATSSANAHSSTRR